MFIVLQLGLIRLVGGTAFAGRIEVYYNGTWGTVCNNSWDMKDANVVCRQLGFPGAVSIQRGANFSLGTGKIWLDNVQCLAFENYLVHCAHNAWGSHRCDHGDDSFVKCKRPVRLVGGNDTSGTVEVLYARKWVTICDGSIENRLASANVVCVELGFVGVQQYYAQTPSTRELMLHGVKCSGDEKSIWECIPSNWAMENCSSNNHFSVNCKGNLSTKIRALFNQNNTVIKLVKRTIVIHGSPMRMVERGGGWGWGGGGRGEIVSYIGPKLDKQCA